MSSDARLADSLLSSLQEVHARKSQDFAVEARLLAELNALYGGDADVVLEVAGTTRMGQVRTAGDLSRGSRLVELMPHALAELEAGRMPVTTAQKLLSLTRNASELVQSEVDRRISARLSPQDAADVHRLVERTVVEVEAELELEAAKQRHAKAKANRGLWVSPTQDGMARIGAEVDAVAARQFALGMDELDRAQKIADDRAGICRTKAQRQADLLTELPHRLIALTQAAQRGDLPGVLGLIGVSGSAQADDGSLFPVEEQPARAAWDREPVDLLAELLSLPVRQPVILNVLVPMSTLLDLDQQACHLAGLGYAPAWQARLLVPTAGLRLVMVHPTTGLPFHVGATTSPPLDIARGPFHPPPDGRAGPDAPPGPGRCPPDRPPDDADNRPTGSGPPRDSVARRDPVDAAKQAELDRERLLMLMAPATVTRAAELQYQPSAALRRLVEIRDLSCSGPGCTRPAPRCELDHETPYSEGGQTAEWGLRALSTRCHHSRHRGWSAVRDPDSGITTWTSPLGRVYTRLPAWDPPRPQPADLRLDPARVEQLPHPEPDYTTDHPLWFEPKLAPAPVKRSSARPAIGWDNGEPPPF